MNEFEYLNLEDLLALTRALRAAPVRDLGLLESACARPEATAFGTEVYPTLEGKAAALLHSLARNHALVDGNKRLAWLATAVFLDLNGRTMALDDASAFRLVMDVAEGLLDVDDIAHRLVTR
ncbi:MAG: alcohol dehydrogenase [Dehalococcoidia bacterium]|nr:alcohol dehydrogenase [Dehalococcoidia bacterium]